METEELKTTATSRAHLQDQDGNLRSDITSLDDILSAIADGFDDGRNEAIRQ